jgi:hypothetical protein
MSDRSDPRYYMLPTHCACGADNQCIDSEKCTKRPVTTCKYYMPSEINMSKGKQETEIHEIANQISFFLGKHNVPLDRLKRLHQKFYDLEDCMKSILWDSKGSAEAERVRRMK